ncbi:MAG: hypothetical protein QXQ40_01920 [Candidatus Aenigmatarchaeota archaeon]
MKKSTKQLVVTLAIVFTMTLSVVAYPFLSILRSESKNRTKEIKGFIIKGNISDNLRYDYLRMGITFLTLIYNESIPNDVINLIEGIPQRFTTTYGEVQIIILEIPGDKNYVVLENINDIRYINVTDNITDEINDQLCEILIYPPVECVISG